VNDAELRRRQPVFFYEGLLEQGYQMRPVQRVHDFGEGFPK